MTEEKILFFADKSTYMELSSDLKYDDSRFNLLYDMVHIKKYLTWEKDCGVNNYSITDLGRLRLYLYRLNYAKNHEPLSYEKRLLFLKDAIKMYPTAAETLKGLLGKNNAKLFNKALEQGN